MQALPRRQRPGLGRQSQAPCRRSRPAGRRVTLTKRDQPGMRRRAHRRRSVPFGSRSTCGLPSRITRR